MNKLRILIIAIGAIAWYRVMYVLWFENSMWATAGAFLAGLIGILLVTTYGMFGDELMER